jgi:excinuclease UvrABC nuclease subunit
MQTFGTLEALLSATAQEMASVGKVPLPVAEKILKTLHL